MAPFSESLKVFLDLNKEKISHGEIRISMGNEACDLDSFISSLVVAYAENAIHVVNMERDVFKAKGEMVWVCDKFGIDIDDLIFFSRPTAHFSPKARKIGAYFDAADGKHSISEKRIMLLLTDHNKPVEEFDDCEIELIIDHHVLSHNISFAKRVYIDLDVGSATTLVSKYLGKDLTSKSHCALSHRGKNGLSSDENRNALCASFAVLLLIPILADTGFLRKRTSEFDISEYKRLKAIARVTERELKGIIKALKHARRNDHEHETNLILQKDFKRFQYRNYSFGGSTVKYPFEEWADREGGKISGVSGDNIGMALMLQLESFRKRMGLDFFFVGTKNKGIRNIIFVNFPFIRSLVKRKKLKSIEYKGLEYYDADKKLTRKILVPVILDIINKHISS